MHPERKVRYAVVGLGWFAQAAILPGFAAAKNSELVALVTGDPAKAKALSDKYSVACHGYGDYDGLMASGQVDAVYIALPNSMHREYTERAARHGVHVLTEKPMAETAADCQAMIDTCAAANVRLMVAYRLHFEEANLKAIEAATSGTIGTPRLFSSVFTQQVVEGNIRLDDSLGGGPLQDIGIYCINAARYLFRAEPDEVSALASWPADKRFEEVPETVCATLRFPGERLATFSCGFGEAKVDEYRLVGSAGDLRMSPAYGWKGELKQWITTEKGTKEATFPDKGQIAPELTYFSGCVLDGREPEPSGLEGLIDVRIIEALRESYKERRPVPLGRFPSKPRPDLGMKMEKPATAKQELIHAAPPSGK